MSRSIAPERRHGARRPGGPALRDRALDARRRVALDLRRVADDHDALHGRRKRTPRPLIPRDLRLGLALRAAGHDAGTARELRDEQRAHLGVLREPGEHELAPARATRAAGLRYVAHRGGQRTAGVAHVDAASSAASSRSGRARPATCRHGCRRRARRGRPRRPWPRRTRRPACRASARFAAEPHGHRARLDRRGNDRQTQPRVHTARLRVHRGRPEALRGARRAPARCAPGRPAAAGRRSPWRWRSARAARSCPRPRTRTSTRGDAV